MPSSSEANCVSLPNSCAAIWSIDTAANTSAPAVSLNGTHGQECAGRPRVIAAALDEIRRLVREPAEQEDPVLELASDRSVGGSSVERPLRLREPVAHGHAVGHVEHAKTRSHRRGRRLAEGGQRRHHAVQQRQREARAKATQHRAAGQVHLGDDHRRTPRLPERLARLTVARRWSQQAASLVARRIAHLKRHALHDPQHERRPAVVVARRISHELAHGWRVLIVDAAAQRVGQQLFRDGPDKLVALAQQRLSKRLAGCRSSCRRSAIVALIGAPLVVFAPPPGRIEVLQREAQRIHRGVAARADGVAPVLLHALAQRSRLALRVVLFQGRHVRRRRRRRRPQQRLEDPLAAQHDRRPVRIRRHRQHARLPQQPLPRWSVNVTRRKWLPYTLGIP